MPRVSCNIFENGFIKGLEKEIERSIDKTAKALSDTLSVGMLKGRTAKEVIKLAQAQPDPEPLYLELWYEGEVCCLFADSNLGKSILAVQIANAISQTRKVGYFDFELSDKQFQLRYTGDNGSLYDFNDNLIRVSLDPDAMDFSGNFEEALIADIEQFVLANDIKVLIIDNLTYLCNASEKGDAAGQLMMNLIKLKKKYGLSILVLAHTPKRNMANPITQNDLAGSKKLYNFFDSCFAIGKSALDENQRYIKQVKVRFGSYKYDGENVIVSNIEKVGAFLQFVNIGYAAERIHLKEPNEKDRAEELERVRELRQRGYSQRKIADELKLSKSKVDRLCKKL